LALPFSHSYGAFGKTGGDRLGGEVCASLTFLRFKISQPSDRFAGHVNPNVLRSSVGIANEGSNATGVENPIKITACRFRGMGELLAGRLDLCAGVMRFASAVLQLRKPLRAAWRTARLERRFE
jgi:hypothetical protein